MKRRIIVTCLVGVLHLVGRFMEGRSITFLTFIALPPTSLVLGAGFLLGLFAVAMWNLIGAFRMWSPYRVRALVPLALCVGCFALGPSVYRRGIDLRIAAFRADLPKFESKLDWILAELRGGTRAVGASSQSNHYGQFWGFNIYAEVDGNGIATVRFVRPVSMNFHHRGYMYRADGSFNAALLPRERIQAPINKNWAAIAD